MLIKKKKGSKSSKTSVIFIPLWHRRHYSKYGQPWNSQVHIWKWPLSFMVSHEYDL